MTSAPSARITPWVGRLLAANAIVLLFQQTIFTSSRLTELLAFTPLAAADRPWTFITYMFLHAGLWHLALNSLALFTFGPPVERRLGGTTFLVYYFYCGIGAALCAMALHLSIPSIGSDSIIGASGAIVGVAFAFARLFPDTPLFVLFIPAPIKAKWAIAGMAAYDAVGLFLHDNVAHDAHLGGLLAGALYFVLRGIARPADIIPMPSLRPRVPVAARGGTSTSGHMPVAAPRAEPAKPTLSADQQRGIVETAEIDRVLDKISATGLESLTPEERLFLDGVARRRRDHPH